MRRKYEFRIDGKSWQWLYKSLKRRGLHGLCNYDEKTVTICSTMSGIDRLIPRYTKRSMPCRAMPRRSM